MSTTYPTAAISDLTSIGTSFGSSYVFPHLHTTSRIVIPARLASTRLPEKLLLRETGKSVLQHTFEAASAAQRPAGITIAVDCERLLREAHSFGGECMMTDANLQSGTDRVAAVAAQTPGVDIFVNVQGDEPEISAEAIDLVTELLESRPGAQVATLAAPIRQRERLEDPACVKVVRDSHQRALYFSRCPIPHARSWDSALLESNPPVFLQHIGLYAYRRDFLLQLPSLPASPLEQIEKLEQLRFLQAGCEVLVGLIEHAPKGIDTPADYRSFVQRQSLARAGQIPIARHLLAKTRQD
ncbi:MAG: 3-deoxy-manno-octulosonate cytidylyltransferase [Pirellulaceae bacterium]|jgi:3-deoxy-manno-octulosonate cytidylyltransferase (CMP-KDO synthetase)|nr:3-deoxy-manno-octulosonate cytidylyltransferase [Pirellulaceae bacterium]